MREALALALAGLLVVSAVLKLSRLSGLRALLLRATGSRPAAAVLAPAVLVAELAVAATLVGSPGVGLPAAAALFGSFALFLSRYRVRLQGMECACFGPALGSGVGPRLIARATVLCALAAAGWILLPPGDRTPASVGLACALIVSVLVLGRDEVPRNAPARDRRVDLPGEPGGRAVLVFLHPDCPVCVRRAAGIGALAPALEGAELRVVVMRSADEDARAHLAGEVGPAARLDHDEVAVALGIRATPVAVAVQAGRVLETRPGPSDQDILALAHGTAGDAWAAGVTRRRLLRQAAVATASLAVLGVERRAGAIAGAARAAARRKPADPNLVAGSCRKLTDRAKAGVRMPDGPRAGAAGHTTVSEPTLRPANLRYFENVAEGFTCPCLARTKPFATLTQCKAECPGGLACFGRQCEELVDSCCVEIFYDVEAAPPGLVTRTLRWTPPPGSSRACRRLGRRFNAWVEQHEQHHRDDALDVYGVRDRDDMRNRHAMGCARSCSEARVQANEKLLQDLRGLKEAMSKEYDERSAAFHETTEGRDVFFARSYGQMDAEDLRAAEGRFVVDCEVCDGT